MCLEEIRSCSHTLLCPQALRQQPLPGGCAQLLSSSARPKGTHLDPAGCTPAPRWWHCIQLVILSPDVIQTCRPTGRGEKAWLPHCPNSAATSFLICKELGATAVGSCSDALPGLLLWHTGLGMVRLFFAQEHKAISQVQNILTCKDLQGQTTSDY